jgi:saccharopine dehydrogenase-like NADP-dependent oxidoreductase
LIVGVGAEGSFVATELARTPDVDEVRLADIRMEACERVARRLKSDKISIHRVDANKIDEIVAVGEGVDVIVNALALLELNMNLIRAALKCKSNYIDVAFEQYSDLLGLSRDFKDRNITAILGAGVAPGTTNLCAAIANDDLDRIDDIRILVGVRDEGNELLVPAAPEIIYMYAQMNSLIFENGEYKEVPPFSNEEVFKFPEPLGEIRVWTVPSEELVILPQNFKGVKNVSIKEGCYPLFDFLKGWYMIGGFSDKPIEVNGVKISPFHVLDALFPRPIPPEELRKMLDAGTVINSWLIGIVEVVGEKRGKKTKYTFTISPPSLRELVRKVPHATVLSYVTGQSPVILTRMLARGEIKTKGVVTLDLLERNIREKYIAKMNALKPPIKIEIKKEVLSLA